MAGFASYLGVNVRHMAMIAHKMLSYRSDPTVCQVSKPSFCIVWVSGVDQQVWVRLRIVFIEGLVVECPCCDDCHVFRADFSNLVPRHVVANMSTVVLCVYLPKDLLGQS